jgi:hypothetical protein
MRHGTMHSTRTLNKTLSTSTSLYPGGSNQQPTTNKTLSSLCRQTADQQTVSQPHEGTPERQRGQTGQDGRDGSGTREIAMAGQCNQQDTVRTAGSETRESNQSRRTSQRQMLDRRPANNQQETGKRPPPLFRSSGRGAEGKGRRGEEGRSSTP